MNSTPTRPRRAVAFTGYRGDGGAIVLRLYADGTSSPLPPRLDLRSHSPTGLDWGYRGSGPAQLALAILAELLGPGADAVDVALDLYQDLKASVVTRWPSSSWSITAAELDDWIETWRSYQLADVDASAGEATAIAEGGAA